LKAAIGLLHGEKPAQAASVDTDAVKPDAEAVKPDAAATPPAPADAAKPN
jgi:hypothetical protein